MRALPWLALAACGSSSSTVRDAGPPDAEVGELGEVHLIGRFADNDQFAWPGTTIMTRFAGSSIAMALEEAGDNQYEVWVDGERQPVLVPGVGTGVFTLAAGLTDGEHDLVVTRRTESFFGVARFEGFPGATLVATPAPTRMIEMVGDSITCGYGVLGDSATCSFDASTEAETYAWGALAAADLGAAHVAIAYSGKGVIRNYGGEPGDTMPLLYERMFADDPDTPYSTPDYTPDVVVVNLGTNDFSVGDPGEAFADGLAAMVAQIRGHHPDAWILLASSPMLSGADRAAHIGYLNQVIDGAGDDRLAYVEIAEQLAADGYGCDYHPNVTTERKMADALVAKIREVAGW